MDLLIKLHHRLQSVVDVFGMRPLAQKVFRRIYAGRFASGKLAKCRQNGRDWWLDPEVGLRGEFAEYETVEWLREVIKPGDTVIDVGANVGQMTLEMAHLVGSTGRVVAIEPANGNLEVLRRHIAGNGFQDRVEIIPAACGEHDGESLEFIIYGDDENSVGSGHHVKFAIEEAADSERQVVKVPVVSLDALCKRFRLGPKVLKIDVEGAEVSVLRGARAMLSDFKPEVRVGFHPFAFDNPQAAAREIRTVLTEINYRQTPYVPPEQWALSEYVFTQKYSR